MTLTPVSVNLRTLDQPTTHIALVAPNPVPAGEMWVLDYISGRIETTNDDSADLESIIFTADPDVKLYMAVPNPPLIADQRTSYQFGQIVRMYIRAGQTLGILVDGGQIVYVDVWVAGHSVPA